MLVTNKRMNRTIYSLRDEHENWYGDQECLLIMVVNCFQNLFQSDHTTLPDFN